MAYNKPCYAFLLLLFVVVVADCQVEYARQRQSEARQCRLRQLSARRPFQTIESEGGLTELWDDDEEQLQCAGVVVRRNTIRPESMTVPSFHNSPGLVYIVQGRAVLGIDAPGCPRSYHSGQQPGKQTEDRHQKIHRVRRGDVVALPPGLTNWFYNDGYQDLITITLFDVTNQINRLDQSLRSFLLAGCQPQQSTYQKEGRGASGDSIISGFDTEMIAEAFNIPGDLARRLQTSDKRGCIVKADERMRKVRPEEQEESMEEVSSSANGGATEAICNISPHLSLDRGEADVFSRRAGKLVSATATKLPVLYFLGLSAEKGNLRPRAVLAPHWTSNAHKILYVTRGEGQLQVVDNQGRTVFNGRVRQGELIVVPQFYVSMKKAGNNGVEWVSFRTSALPVRVPVAGDLSVLNGMPAHVLANSYGLSFAQARQLKSGRRQQLMLFSPRTTAAEYTR